jgi:FkbM family methyltransferase
MKIAIIDIIGLPYDGTTVYSQGLGGSESAVTFIAEELAQIGFSVTVFNNCDIDHARPGMYNGVNYRPLADLAAPIEFDIVISSRTVIPFVDPANYHLLGDGRAMVLQNYNIYQNVVERAKMRVLWMHDTFCLGDNLIEELATSNRITDIFTLSDFHLSYVGTCNHGRRRMFEVLKRKFFITRNGAKSYRSEIDIAAKDRNLFVYNASVTKGMVPLVNDIWPIVKREIPTARLKVIGGYYRFSASSGPDQQEQDWRRMVADPKYATMGIEFTGVIPQREIANILTEASYMIYPCAFPETYGISTLESLLYNTPSITCRFGALEEIALDQACYQIDYPVEPNGLFPDINRAEQVQKFAAMAVRAYTDTYLHQQKQYYCNSIKDIAGWDSVAIQWKQHFYRQTGHYLSRDDYIRVTKINKKVHRIWGRRYTNPAEFDHYKPSKEQPIAIVSTFYNAENYIGRCIESIACQDYDNYQVYLVNDASTDNTLGAIAGAIARLPEDIQDRFNIINNTENRGAVANQVNVFRQLPDPEAIVMILDGDDSLVNRNDIFTYYNGVYDGTTEFTYGSCWSMVDNIPLISQPYPESVKQARAYRQHHFNWILPYTHLRTFKQRLIDAIPDSAFQDEQGNWYRAGGDGSTFYSLIEAADPAKVKCLQEVVYNYNDASPLNDYKVNGDEQNRTARSILNKKPVEKFSVIVPTMWRVPDQFTNFVKSLCESDYVGEIIVIDNDHSQKPADFPEHAKIKIYDFGKNIFVNPAWNFGVRSSQFDRVCIVNDDVVFDLKLFEKLQGLVTPTEGVFGLCPGTADFNQPPVTTGTIDIIPWTGQHTYGFGCLMIMHRRSWQDIPKGLDIYYGDNYIFDLQLERKKTNYLITNMMFQSQFAATTSDRSLTGGVLEKETPVYQQVKAQMTLENTVQTKTQPVLANAPKKKILIAIPTARNIEPETFKSIYNLEVPDGYETVFQYFYGYNIDQVRNLIADWVVKGYDYLFSVDSDIAFPPDTLKKLLAHNKDMVSGLYIQRKPGLHILEVYEHNSHGGVSNIPYEKLVGRGLVEIASCGFGCVLIKAEVMRAIPYPHFKYHSAIDHRNTVSEDVDFCRKALGAGFKIWADTDIHCRHIGQAEFVIDTSIRPASVESRLRELGGQRLLPRDHVNYLASLAASGFQPKVIYDIGSCVLHWTNEARQIWPSAKIYLFEAMSSCEFLYRENGYEYQMGVLSSQDGVEIDFWQNEEHPGGNSYYRENTAVNPQADQYFNERHRRRLISRSLDSVVKERGFSAPDLLKMDVQGAELDILKGATELIKSVNDVILELQVVEYNKGAPLRDEVINYMNQLGFDCLGLFCNNGPDGDYHFRRRT